jgi:pyochelin biosynthesis protein PchC
VNCPVTALVGTNDSTVTLDDARRWADCTTGPFEARQLPGGHFYLEEWPAELTDPIAGRAAAGFAGAD